MADIFSSKRLTFRAIDPDEDEGLFIKLKTDPLLLVNASFGLHRPQSKADAKHMLKAVSESLMSAIILLPAADAASKPITIGQIHLGKEDPVHCRYTEVGVDILPAYQGRGYGTEAINWALDWAFNTAGMHRVVIRAFEYNEGARRLYARLGFKLEGVSRELVWHAGRWWDDHQFAMLDWEWKELRQADANAGVASLSKREK